MAKYTVEIQWGGTSAPWIAGGEWVLGNRDDQNPIHFDISSNDGGKTFEGFVIYKGEGHLKFKAEWISDNNYNVETTLGNDPWKSEGVFVIGNRDIQRVVSLKFSSNDGGKTLFDSEGLIYDGERWPLGFRATLQ